MAFLFAFFVLLSLSTPSLACQGGGGGGGGGNLGNGGNNGNFGNGGNNGNFGNGGNNGNFGNGGNNGNIDLLSLLLGGVSGGTVQQTGGGQTPTPEITPEMQVQVGPCECGVKKEGSPRIIGGKFTEVNEYPWQVGIVDLRKEGKSHIPFCGGTLVNAQWILTAAHCVFGRNPNELKVVLGEHDWLIIHEADHLVERINEILIHPDLDTSIINYDFALLRLNRPVDFTRKHIRPICQPPHSFPVVGSEVIATGWGSIAEKNNSRSARLREVELEIIDQDRCRDFYKKETITDVMFCAGYVQGGKDACQGDSGGPLMWRDRDDYHRLVGVTSWGTGCARRSKPGVYARVEAAWNWVRSNIGSPDCPRHNVSFEDEDTN